VRDVADAEHSILAHGGKLLTPPRLYATRPAGGYSPIRREPCSRVLQSSSGDPEDVLAAPGEWIWSSVMARDPDQDAAFYQNVFGYEVLREPARTARCISCCSTEEVAAPPASTHYPPAAAAQAHPHWLNFVRVTSATDTAARVESLGGRVLVQPFRDRHGGLVGRRGRSGGAPFGLLEWTTPTSKDTAKMKTLMNRRSAARTDPGIVRSCWPVALVGVVLRWRRQRRLRCGLL